MTTAQVVETSVTVNNNSPIQDYVHPDDQTLPTFEMTPGFKPFTVLSIHPFIHSFSYPFIPYLFVSPQINLFSHLHSLNLLLCLFLYIRSVTRKPGRECRGPQTFVCSFSKRGAIPAVQEDLLNRDPSVFDERRRATKHD